jgi:hypothetical protein
MHIRIVQTPPVPSIDGLALDGFAVGAEYEVGNTLAALFLAEGWAEPVDKTAAPNLVKEQVPPYLNRDLAADFPWHRKPRRGRAHRTTSLCPEKRCDSCGGMLVPPTVIPESVASADYLCLQCGRPYSWSGTPPTLTTNPTSKH